MWLLIDDVRDLSADAIARTPEAGQRLSVAPGPACAWTMTRHVTFAANPEHTISQQITEIIGINNAMVAGKPIFADIAQAFIDFVSNDKLIVHNAGDREFLDFEFFNIDLGGLIYPSQNYGLIPLLISSTQASDAA